MARDENLPFPLGTPFTNDPLSTISDDNLPGTNLVGKKYVVEDRNPNDVAGFRTGHSKTVMVCRNVSGGTLYPKHLVIFENNDPARGRVIGTTSTTSQKYAGVIDEYLGSAGVADNDLFYVTVSGPTLVKGPLAGSAYGGDIAIGDNLAALTAATSQLTGATTGGRVRKESALSSTTYNATESAFNDQVRVGRGIIALSAQATTGPDAENTNKDILCFVKDLYA